MATDFGAEIDAALKESLERVHAAAEQAIARIDASAEPLHAALGALAPDDLALADAALPFQERAPAGPGGPAVSFDLEEAPLEFPDAPSDHLPPLGVDDEGIPLPEENPGASG